MAQTAEAMQEKVHIRGRRPGIQTLDSRLEELETTLEGRGKISNRRLSEMHDAALTMEHHYNGHKENGEKVNPQLKRVQAVLEALAARVDLPATNSTESEGETAIESDALGRIRRIRKQRQEVLNRLTELQRQEEELYPEIGRLVVEEALGQPA